MLGSLDPSKRKICVTVFLDELFEELSDDHDSSTRETHSVVQIEAESSQEDVKSTWENYDSPQNSRPRKPRAQSKFGKSNENYKPQAKCDCCGKGRNVMAESKSSLEMEFPEIITCKPPTMTDSGSGSHIEKIDQEVDCASKVLSESIMTDESFLSASRSYTKKVDQEVDCSSNTLSYTKSTQCDSSDVEVTTILETKKSESKGVQVNVRRPSDEWIKLSQLKTIRERSPEKTLKENEILILGRSSEQITNFSAEEVIRIWSTCKKVWSEGYESEMSEVDCITFKEDNSNKQYTVLVETDMESGEENERGRNYLTQFVIPPRSDTKCNRLRYGSQDPKPNKSVNIDEKTNKLFDCRAKNFAEGDTLEEPIPKYVLKFESKEKVLVCTKQTRPSKGNGFVVNAGELSYSDTAQPIAEVFKKENENSDAESDTLFAERPIEGETSKIYTQVIDLEEKSAPAKCLRRMKTVEVLTDTSVDEMNNMNTEVILFCDSLSGDVSVEAWEEGSKDLSEARELYLKESKNSSVYLIEIPFQFVKPNRNKESVACRTDTD